MRRIALVASAALVALAVAAPSAFAVNSIFKYEASVSPSKAGSKKKPRAVELRVRPFYDTLEPDAEAPFAWTEATVHLPKELVFNGKYFPSCKASQVRTESGRKKCKKAEIGKVDAKGFALGLVEPLKVNMYNLPGGKGVAMYLQGDNPVIIDHVIEGKLKKVKGKYGWELSFNVPADLQQPAPGAWATPLDFKTKVSKRTITKTKTKKVKGKKRKTKTKYPFVALVGCKGSLNFGFSTKNSDGSSHLVELTQSCKK